MEHLDKNNAFTPRKQVKEFMQTIEQVQSAVQSVNKNISLGSMSPRSRQIDYINANLYKTEKTFK